MAAITSNTRLATMPGNVALPQAMSGLDRDSVINVTQLATIDRAALEASIGKVPGWLVAQVDDGLRLALGL